MRRSSSSPSISSAAPPSSSNTHSAWGWSSQTPGGLAWPAETMRSMRRPGCACSVVKTSIDRFGITPEKILPVPVMFPLDAPGIAILTTNSLHVLLAIVAKKRESVQYFRHAGRSSGKDSRPIMEDTRTNGGVGTGGASGHDMGFSFTPAVAGPGEAPRAEPPAAPTPADLRAEIRDLIAANPAPQPDDASLLALMALHD